MTENLCRKSIKNAVEVKEYQILYHLRELYQQIGNAKMTNGIFNTFSAQVFCYSCFK